MFQPSSNANAIKFHNLHFANQSSHVFFLFFIQSTKSNNPIHLFRSYPHRNGSSLLELPAGQFSIFVFISLFAKFTSISTDLSGWFTSLNALFRCAPARSSYPREAAKSTKELMAVVFRNITSGLFRFALGVSSSSFCSLCPVLSHQRSGISQIGWYPTRPFHSKWTPAPDTPRTRLRLQCANTSPFASTSFVFWLFRIRTWNQIVQVKVLHNWGNHTTAVPKFSLLETLTSGCMRLRSPIRHTSHLESESENRVSSERAGVIARLINC